MNFLTGKNGRDLPRGFEAVERCLEIEAEMLREVAAFLHEHGRQADAGQRRADPTKSLGGDLEAGERIVLGGIEAEGDDERAGRKGLDGLRGGLEGRHVAIVAGAARQRNVEIGAEAGTGAALMRIAPEEGIEG